MRTKVLAAAGALVLVVVGWLVFFGKSDEDQIKETLDRLAAIVEVKEGANPILKAARIRDELAVVLADDVHVSIPELGGVREGRQGIVEAAAQAQLGFQTAHVDLRRVEVKLDDAKQSAQASSEAQLKGKTRGGDTRRDDRNVDFLLRKADGTWKITSVTVWAPK
jgi:ketosteroid isomerase-like protein